MSLLKLNKLFRVRNQNEKGFSLVELMIAVGILSAVSFGIFKSFQVGFWGMSDARARTIATNLAQEKLEEVKGKALENIEKFEDPNSPIELSGKEFRVFYEIEDAPEKPPQASYSVLKKIVVTVSWQKRDGAETEIQVEGLQSRTEFFRDLPFSILLTINPKNGMIKRGDEAEITVTILDQDNYPIPFEGIINLTLTMYPDDLGDLDPEEGNLVFNGDSSSETAIFKANKGKAGKVEITAKDVKDNLIPDSKELTITGKKPDKIHLEAEPSSILFNGEQSLIAVKILDEDGYLAESWTGKIELEITSGENTGYLSYNSSSGKKIEIEFDKENIKNVEFTSSEQEEQEEDEDAVIKATDITDIGGEPKLNSGEVTIGVRTGDPFQIGVTANPYNIRVNGTSVVTVTILNEKGMPVSGFNGQVSLSLISGSAFGSLSDTDTQLTFNGEKYLTATFTAKTVPGEVEIKADYIAGNFQLKPSTVKITIGTGEPKSIKIDANPKVILNDGTDVSHITTTFLDSGGNKSSFEDEVELSFDIDPDEGTLSTETLTLPAGYSSNTGIPVTYFCDNQNFEDDVTITVNCDNCEGLNKNWDEVTIEVASRAVKPATNPNIRYGKKRIYWFYEVEDKSKILFDIEVLGGKIDISQIDLAWKEGNTNEKLTGITIYQKDNPNRERIKKNWSPSSNYQLVKVYEERLEIKSFDTLLSLEEREYTVELRFDKEVTNRIILIQFHGSYIIKNKKYEHIYEMEFFSPDLIV